MSCHIRHVIEAKETTADSDGHWQVSLNIPDGQVYYNKK